MKRGSAEDSLLLGRNQRSDESEEVESPSFSLSPVAANDGLYQVTIDGVIRGYALSLRDGRWQGFKKNEVSFQGSSAMWKKIPRRAFNTQEEMVEALQNGRLKSGRF